MITDRHLFWGQCFQLQIQNCAVWRVDFHNRNQKNVRNPNHHYFSKKYRNTPPICIAIRLPFVSQYFRCPYALRKGKCRQYSSHLYRNTPPICIAIRLPLVSQYFWENLGGCGHWDAPQERDLWNEKFMNFAHFCEFCCFSLGKRARFTLNFCSGMPLGKVHELTFLSFGLPGPLLKNEPQQERVQLKGVSQSRKCAINNFWTKNPRGLLRWGSRGSRQIIYVRIFPNIWSVFGTTSRPNIKNFRDRRPA